jgi:hypothetical protein
VIIASPLRNSVTVFGIPADIRSGQDFYRSALAMSVPGLQTIVNPGYHVTGLFVCLFLELRPPVGQGTLMHEVSRSHTMTHHSR